MSSPTPAKCNPTDVASISASTSSRGTPGRISSLRMPSRYRAKGSDSSCSVGSCTTSSITITEERLKSVSFAQPYYDSDQSLTVRADSGIGGLADMSGKVVGVDTGSTGDMWATANTDAHGFAEIRRYEGLNPAMLDLEAGRLDGYISDIPALLYYVRDKPQFEVVERIPTGERYSVMFAKDAPLAAEVDEVITAMKEDGTLAAIHEKWFGKAPEAGTSTAEVLPMP